MLTHGHWMHRILSSPLPQITELKSRLGDSEAQRETLQAEMSSLQSRHSAEVTSLQSQCSAMQAKCAGLQDQMVKILRTAAGSSKPLARKQRRLWSNKASQNALKTVHRATHRGLTDVSTIYIRV